MKQLVRDYFTFNKRERNGVFILVSIIALLLIYHHTVEYFTSAKKVDITHFVRELDSLNAAEEQVADAAPSGNAIASEADLHSEKQEERFDFDPNGLPEADWKRLGLNEKQIRTIKNYESKGGKFRKKEDLKKMYCIRPELFASLEKYISIQSEPAVSSVNEKMVASPAAKAAVSVELNTADSSLLTTIRGIGPFYAKSIIKYRDQLGGFYAKEQLMEVWKFDQEKFGAVEKFITVDASLIKKININTCEAEQLKNPYIRWNAANAIVNYRKQHGKFKTIDEIKNTDLVDDETLRKIAPYLVLE